MSLIPCEVRCEHQRSGLCTLDRTDDIPENGYTSKTCPFYKRKSKRIKTF
ncbi:MAG: hypothetical protein IJL87_03110 [Clostridia bacterium]|nr:hypothetical protein [Clostridia bacterium]